MTPSQSLLQPGPVVDNSEHKPAERELNKAFEFAEGITTAIPNVLSEVDEDGRYLQVCRRNPELLAMARPKPKRCTRPAVSGETELILRDVIASEQERQ